MSNVGPLDSTKATSEFDAYAAFARTIIANRVRPEQGGPIGGPLPKVPMAALKAPRPQMPLQSTSVAEDKGKVGILGAGIGGLYAGMMLESLGIPFEILEASDRTGGRVFTHEFSSKPHDYYDVGAMRFPQTKVMQRLFHLFHHHSLNSDGLKLASHLIPYHFTDVNEATFLDFNGIRARRNEVAQTFDFEATGVPSAALKEGSNSILARVYDIFVEAFESDVKKPQGGELGWKLLKRFDKYSTRSYMALNHGFDQPTINWLETMSAGSGWFDQALSESVLEYVAFGGDLKHVDWFCLDGGSQVLPQIMEEYLAKHAPGALKKNAFVTKVESLLFDTQDVKDRITNRDRMAITVNGEQKSRFYNHVISTIPLPVFRTLSIDNAGLSVTQMNALRQLQYGPSVKIGIKFRSQWWKDRFDIVGGQSYSDRCIRTTVYPSYGVGDNEKTTVLIASYTWKDDAHRFSALVNPPAEMKKQAEDRLKELVLRDLAHVHDIDYDFLVSQYESHFAWDWNNNPLSQGAFAFFGPGEFSTLYKEMCGAAAGGYLHFAGEALSIRHAWIVGALDSAWRAVAEVISVSYPELIEEFEKKWGYCEEWAPPEDIIQGWGTAPEMKSSLLASYIALKHSNVEQ